MPPKSTNPLLDRVRGLRSRQRADKSWQVWWEPSTAMRAAGASNIDLSDEQPGNAVRKATSLNTKWAKAMAGETAKPAKPGRSVNDLITDYRASLSFKTKAPNTQRAYGADLRAIAAKWGTMPVVTFDKPTITTWYEALYAARGVDRSRAIIRMFSILFSHAETRGWRAENTNPCLSMRLLTPAGRSRTASWDEFDHLVRTARRMRSRMIVAGLHLALMCGQRQMDILLATPGDFYQAIDRATGATCWVWQLTQNKTGKDLEVPIVHKEAVAVLRAQLHHAGHAGPGTLIWDPVTGKPFTLERFFYHWEKVRAEAAKDMPSLKTLTWRDLRRTFSNMSRAGGSSDADTADVLGNTAAKDSKLRRVYMAPQLATAIRAVAAVQRPSPSKEKRKTA